MKSHTAFQYLVISLIMMLFFTGCSQLAASPTATPEPVISTNEVVAEGHIMPKADIKLFFPVRGRISEILVTEGQSVHKGDMLARMGDNEQAQSSLAAAELELKQAQQAYDVFMRVINLSSAQAFEAYQAAQTTRAKAQLIWEAVDINQINDDIDTAETTIRDKKKLLDDAKDNLAKYVDLKPENPTRKTAEDDVRKAEAEYNTAIREVETLQRSKDGPRAALDTAVANEAETLRVYELTKNNAPNPDQQVLLVARLDLAKAQVASSKAVLANYELTAPFDGLVTDINVVVSELIGSDKFAFQMEDASQWFVETSDLTELEVVNVYPGQSVEIIPDALPDLQLKGIIENIGSSYKTQGGDILYTVKIRLLDSDPRLKWGMTVQSTFAVETK